MAHTTGPHTRGYVVILEDTTGTWVLCRDGCWMALEAAQAGQQPMATHVRLCPDMKRAWSYARQHTYTTTKHHVGGERTWFSLHQPRVISARAAGLPQAVCR